MENQLRCFSLETGELIWSVKTQRSLLRSQKKQSLIIKNLTTPQRRNFYIELSKIDIKFNKNKKLS